MTHGSADVSRPTDTRTEIDQQTRQAIIEYDGFDVAGDETVQFNQPGSSAKVLNRVLSNNPSEIRGALKANGQVYLTNPAGILFGPNSTVNVGRLYAAAGYISDENFLNGTNLFENLSGTVENLGELRGTGIHLLGKRVANFGSIDAKDGVVTMSSGKDVLLGSRDGHMFAKIEDSGQPTGEEKAGVKNEGPIEAGDGAVRLSAGDLYATSIYNQGGTIKAETIELGGGDGKTLVSGTLNVSTTAAGEEGGSVQLLGEKIGLVDLTVTADGPAGGGTISVGGSKKGAGPLPNARQTIVGSDVDLSADATSTGDGGRVIVWSDEHTSSQGSISATGGVNGGNGGFVEVSGGSLQTSISNVDVTAPAGENGTRLFDPATIRINAGSSDGTDDEGGDSTLLEEGGDQIVGFSETVNSDPFNVFESELEGTTAGDIVLRATEIIEIDGTNNDFTDSGGVADSGDILLSPDISLTLETKNASASGAIDLVSNATEGANLVIETRGTGTITINGGTDRSNASDVIVPNLVTADQNISVGTNVGSVSVQGKMNAGTATVTLGASTVNLSADLIGGTISGTGVNQVNINDTAAEIQDGINVASSGATVDVSTGIYKESINITKPLTLQGPYAGTNFDGTSSDRGGEAEIQPPFNSGDDGVGPEAAIHVTADNVTVDGFLLDGRNGAQEGINNYDPSGGKFRTVSNFTVKNNIVKDFLTYGVLAWNGRSTSSIDVEVGLTTGWKLTNNRIDGIDGVTSPDGNGFDQAGRAVMMETDGIIETVTDNVIVEDNPATGETQYGIQTGNLGLKSDASDRTITISGNTIDVEDNAIWANQHFGNTGPAVTITGNTATATVPLRIQSMRENTGLITVSGGNTFTSDTLVSNCCNGSATFNGRAILVFNSDGPVEIIGNTIIGTDGDGTPNEGIGGIDIFNGSVDVISRVKFGTIEDDAVQVIDFNGPSDLGAFSGYDDSFDFSKVQEDVLNVDSSSSARVIENDLSGTDMSSGTFGGLSRLNYNGATKDLSGNWWGTTDASTIDSSLTSGSVDFTPFLNNGTDQDTNTAGFEGDFSTLNVTALGSQIGTTGRIQEGINRVDSAGSVNVETGIYKESINITKPLTLQGPYAGTNFDGTSSDRGNEAEIKPPFNSGDDGFGSEAAIHVTADNVTVDGFLLEGQDGAQEGINNYDPSGGTFRTIKNFTVKNNIVKDFLTDGVVIFNGRDVGSVVTEDGMTTGGTVTNNRIDGIDGASSAAGDGFDLAGRSISFDSDGIIETVTDNVIRANPAASDPVTDQSQYGIQTGNQGINSDASGLTISIKRNDIDVEDRGIWANQHFGENSGGNGSGPSTEIENNKVSATEALRIQSMREKTGLISVTNGNTFTAKNESSKNAGGGNLPGNAVVVENNAGPIEIIGNTVEATDSDATSGENIDGIVVKGGGVGGTLDRIERVNFGTIENDAIHVVGGSDPANLSRLSGYDGSFDFSNVSGDVLNVETGGGARARVIENDLSGSAFGGLSRLNYNGGTKDLSGNWWGTTDVSSIETTAGASNDFTPFLTSGDADGGTSGFQGDFSTLTVVPNGGQVGTTGRIKEGINLVNTAGTVNVSSGTFTENVTVDRSLTLSGTGSGSNPSSNTVLDGGDESGVGMEVTASGVTVKDLRLTRYRNGIHLDGTMSTLKFTNVSSVENENSGMDVRSGSDVDDLTLNNVNFSGGTDSGGGFVDGEWTGGAEGVLINDTAEVTKLTIKNSSFNNNDSSLSDAGAGIKVKQNENNPGALNDVTIKNSTFNGNQGKGMYFEKLSEATIKNVTIKDSGTGGDHAFNNGIDLNLKFESSATTNGDYKNITIRDSEFDNSGVHTTDSNGDDYAAALAIKARGQGNDSSYDSTPATVRSVEVKNNTFSFDSPGTDSTTVRVGEPGSGAHPEDVTLRDNKLSAGTAHVENVSTTVGSFIVDASANWWGTTDHTTIDSSLTRGPIDFTPFLGSGSDTAPGTPGFQGDFSTLFITNLGAQSGSLDRFEEGLRRVQPGGRIFKRGNFGNPLVPRGINLRVSIPSEYGRTEFRNSLVRPTEIVRNIRFPVLVEFPADEASFPMIPSLFEIHPRGLWTLRFTDGYEMLQFYLDDGDGSGAADRENRGNGEDR